MGVELVGEREAVRIMRLKRKWSKTENNAHRTCRGGARKWILGGRNRGSSVRQFGL
jgi:hypothetical protein